MDTFFELVFLLSVALGIAILMQLLKQPMIIGYILAGITIGFLGIVEMGDSIQAFAHIGVALLLFLVGLNLNPKTIRETGKASIVTGVGQVLFTSIIGYAISRMLNFSHIESVYLAIALTFSSTIIISKLLSDKGELNSLYGRISIGFLIIQDIIAIIILILLTRVDSITGIAFDLAILLGIGVITVLLLSRVMKFMAKTQELLMLFSISWCLVVAALFHKFGLSLEAGALIAGMTLSMSPYRHEIAARLRPLRDFFILMFFIVLGVQMDFTNIAHIIIPGIIFSLFILIGNPLIVIILMSIMGYTRRTSFKAGLTVAQISEFSLILIGLGVALGQVSPTLLSLTTIVGLITIAGSTYLILYANKIQTLIDPVLKLFERKKVQEKDDEEEPHEILLLGCGRIGLNIIHDFAKLKKKFLVIEYNPEIIQQLKHRHIPFVYGDAEDPELLDSLGLRHIKMAISTIPKKDANLVILQALRKENQHAIFTALAHSVDDALTLYDAGASYVLLPHDIGSQHMSTLLDKHGLDGERYLEEKIAHIEHLKLKK